MPFPPLLATCAAGACLGRAWLKASALPFCLPRSVGPRPPTARPCPSLLRHCLGLLSAAAAAPRPCPGSSSHHKCGARARARSGSAPPGRQPAGGSRGVSVYCTHLQPACVRLLPSSWLLSPACTWGATACTGSPQGPEEVVGRLAGAALCARTNPAICRAAAFRLTSRCRFTLTPSPQQEETWEETAEELDDIFLGDAELWR